MPAREHAVLQDRSGRPTLIFERVLAHPPERVWRALTRRDELVHWHPTPFELDADSVAVGGHVSYVALAGAPEMRDGRVLACDPPRLLAHTWGDDELRWELSEHEQGCLLRLSHSFDDRLKAARDAAGWHLCLDALSSSLAGASKPQRGSEARLPEGWSELNRDYQRRFEIAPDRATPPPG